MSNEDLRKIFARFEKAADRIANEAATEADKDINKAKKQVKVAAEDIQETFKNEYADMERKALRAMTDVFDNAKSEIDIAEKKFKNDSKLTYSNAMQEVIKLTKKNNEEIEAAKKRSIEAFDNTIRAKLKSVCQESEDYYKCTLTDAYKKAAALFEAQKREFAAKTDKTYSTILKEMDIGYGNIFQAQFDFGKKQTSDPNLPGPSKGRKSK